MTIALVWVISAAIGSPIALGLNYTPNRDTTICVFYNSDFIIYSSLSSFYIPCIIMVVLYWRIFKVSHFVSFRFSWLWDPFKTCMAFLRDTLQAIRERARRSLAARKSRALVIENAAHKEKHLANESRSGLDKTSQPDGSGSQVREFSCFLSLFTLFVPTFVTVSRAYKRWGMESFKERNRKQGARSKRQESEVSHRETRRRSYRDEWEVPDHWLELKSRDRKGWGGWSAVRMGKERKLGWKSSLRKSL